MHGHRTRATGRTLSVRCSPDSCAERVAKPPAHRTLSTGLTPVRPVHTCATDPHRTLWTSVRCYQHQRPVRETLPRLLQNSHRRNRKYTLNFLKSAESRLASSTGGREEPTPLSTLGTPPPLQMCQHHQVYTTMCMCVSIFINIFPKELASQLATSLDPNTHAKLDRSSGTR